ncbi:hypothetical protein HMPREF9135_2275 [Segatella baroniae F0067]|uniref:Uncharacterized protein n=1 Tax=Segatella baroniae F0067 TaxID=1115809 RepID=U2NJE8_9BACT|nr:hypothetical protein HMPREF9135_2275 [Segatella baroniae F0067]
MPHDGRRRPCQKAWNPFGRRIADLSSCKSCPLGKQKRRVQRAKAALSSCKSCLFGKQKQRVQRVKAALSACERAAFAS